MSSIQLSLYNFTRSSLRTVFKKTNVVDCLTASGDRRFRPGRRADSLRQDVHDRPAAAERPHGRPLVVIPDSPSSVAQRQDGRLDAERRLGNPLPPMNQTHHHAVAYYSSAFSFFSPNKKKTKKEKKFSQTKCV